MVVGDMLALPRQRHSSSVLANLVPKCQSMFQGVQFRAYQSKHIVHFTLFLSQKTTECKMRMHKDNIAMLGTISRCS